MPIRSSRKKVKEALPKCFVDYFLYGEENYSSEDDASLDLLLMMGSKGEEDLRTLWGRHKERILSQWIKNYPGERPFIWWRLDSPEPQRQRLGGTGTPQFEVLNVAPRYHFGLPIDWVSQWQQRYYNGLAKDIHGQPIGTEYSG